MTSLSALPSPDYAEKIKNLIYSKPFELQQQTLNHLVSTCKDTLFGREHNFQKIKDHESFKNYVPVIEYHDLDKYWDLIFKGEQNVFWPGSPMALAMTSASTGTAKYIPVTKESITASVESVIRITLQYMHDERDYDIFNHHLLNLTSSPILKQHFGIPCGSMSGICRGGFAPDLSAKSFPSLEAFALMASGGSTAVFQQTLQDIMHTTVSAATGLPSWIAQFFQLCCTELNTNNLTKLMPQMRLLCTSGVNYRPYMSQFQNLFDHDLHVRELYGASEGMLAYQDTKFDDGLLLNLNSGIYFEFIPLEDVACTNPRRYDLTGVVCGVPYVPVITTNAGLWGYKMGDIIQFNSISPFKISIIGRTKHFISLAAENVYTQQVDDAMVGITEMLNGRKVINFTVAPGLMSTELSHHVWYIELDNLDGLSSLLMANMLDQQLIKSSPGYFSKRRDHLLGPAKVHFVKSGAFLKYLTQKDPTNLQLKVQKVCNNRDMADFMINNDLVISSQSAYSLEPEAL